jgi:hypothetical protein
MTNGKILVAFFMTLLAVSLTGTDTPGIGFAKECTDGINNDNQEGADGNDADCLSYPYADGLGEVTTQIGADYQGDYYEVSLWDYWYEYSNFAGDDAYWCAEYATRSVQFANTQAYSNDKDRASDDYEYWYAQNCS